MKWDRLPVFVVAVVFLAWANIVPNTFPQSDYGRGFPLKWTRDPLYRPSDDYTPPYLRQSSEAQHWVFDRAALAVDLAVGLALLGVALAVNELFQTSLGRRPPGIPPHLG